MAFEINVVEDFRGLFVGSMEFGRDLLDAEKFILVAEEFELVTEIAYLIVVEA